MFSLSILVSDVQEMSSCVRYSVGKHASILRDLKPSDFDPKEKYWTRFAPEGSKITPPHQSVEFRWKDYCPMVFRYFFFQCLTKILSIHVLTLVLLPVYVHS